MTHQTRIYSKLFCAVRERTETKMAAKTCLTLISEWPQLLVANWLPSEPHVFVFFPPILSFVFIWHPCFASPSPVSHQGQNAAEQQTQIVAINFRLVYGLGLLAHLLMNSCNRHHCPLMVEHRATRPQLHPAQPALWMTSVGWVLLLWHNCYPTQHHLTVVLLKPYPFTYFVYG